ncbi:hypothetical protein HZC53_00525 [Candidatus Uhrbacteria bacterium]|nr:hypothetical protein [Candidatus Uhrbacteria bacterium]
MHEYTFTLTNLNCAACGKVCAMIIKKFKGVESVDIRPDGLTKIVSNRPLDMILVLGALKDQGYTAVTK